MTLAKSIASRHSNPETSGGDESANSNAMGVIEALGGVLRQKRDEAIQWRTQSGIEQDWQEDEEFYMAMDRANPEGESHVGKPLSADGGAINQPVVTGRSSVFIPITRAYVDAASARVADMLLPNDDAPWQIKPTPQAEMAPTQGAMNPIAGAAAATAGNAPMPMMLPGVMQGAAPTPASPAGMGGNPGMPAPAAMPMGVTSQVFEALPDEDKKAERANKVIEDWLVECQWHAETRKMIEDAALLGTGVLKGPFPVERSSMAYLRGPDGIYRAQVQKEMVPVSKRVNPRMVWTDPAGGENHQEGSYVWELDQIGSRMLRKLLNDDSYIQENILRALREGPGAKSGKDDVGEGDWRVDVGATYPFWYFYGDIDKATMIAAGVPEEDLPEGEDEAVAIPAVVMMVNDHVIKVAQTPLDAGGFPYDIFRWQRRPGIPWGKGVARQVRTPQRMLNAAVRAEMDNGAFTSGPIMGIRRDWVQAADGNNSVVTPRKLFYITQSAPPQAKMEDCISTLNVQSNILELEHIIDRAMRFAEDATGLPMLMQGQQGEATTTATGMTILNNNGSTVLRRIARTFDDQVTEPHIRRYYYWLLAHEGNDEAKGDFQIDARGSSYLVDRELQAQNLNQLFPLFAQHPDVHPGRLAEEVARANRISYERIMLTDAEKQQRDSQPPPKPPQVEVAEIRAKTEAQKLEQKERNDMRQAQLAEGKLQAEVERGIGELATRLNISEENIKAMLAAKVMDVHTGRQQAQEQRAHESGERGVDRQHERINAIEQRDHEKGMKPPAETPGKAPAGEGFSK